MRSLLPALTVISAAWAQTWTTGWDSKEFLQYGCKPIMLFFAKATFEPGNMVIAKKPVSFSILPHQLTSPSLVT